MVEPPRSTYNPVDRTWSGPKRTPFYDFDCSVGRIIYNSLRKYPKNLSQVCVEDGKSATNLDIYLWSVRLAVLFKQRGLRHDSVIGISAKNSTYVTPAAVACLFNATPFHAVNPTLELKTLTHVFTLTQPQIIFCDATDYGKLREATAAWKPEFITLTGRVEGVPYVEDLLTPIKTEMFYQPQPLLLGGDQTLAILCSSGTTGPPKAVCLSNSLLYADNPLINSEAVVYCGSSLDWYSGVVMFMYNVVDGCTRIISDQSFSAENFVELVEKYKITAASFAPRHASALLACPKATPQKLASLEILAVAGGWIPATTLQQLQNLAKNGFVLFGYGTTEFGGVGFGIFNAKTTNTVGTLVAGVRVRIVDDNGKNLTHNEVGELWVNHGRKWSGYYGNPLESQRTQDSLGWFRSGDIGYFDADNNLYIVDRKKEVYKCLGMQYWATELEQAIFELPDVQEVCVVGLYDDKYGDAPTAMVVLRPGSALTEQHIKDHVAKRLVSEYKQLHGGVQFASELPQNANGKVLRREVKEKLANGK